MDEYFKLNNMQLDASIFLPEAEALQMILSALGVNSQVSSRCLHVEIAELKAAVPPTELVSIGLGSCVGVCLYDPVARVGGLAHVMLPESSQGCKTEYKGKFADTAVPALILEMLKLGAVKSRLVAKITGGAQMFKFANTSELMSIGELNVKSVLEVLKKESIPVVFQDTGKTYGRSIRLCISTGQLYIKSIAHQEKVV